mmetsp:Transcript_30779/g.42635  ORF Transcript_30779/g.42635 Transcript_30779/m.42635 type:complete len:81 (-) Transcript_30779:528-770(-)
MLLKTGLQGPHLEMKQRRSENELASRAIIKTCKSKMYVSLGYSSDAGKRWAISRLSPSLQEASPRFPHKVLLIRGTLMVT